MEITEVRIFPVDEQNIRAYVIIVIDGFMIRDLKITYLYPPLSGAT